MPVSNSFILMIYPGMYIGRNYFGMNEDYANIAVSEALIQGNIKSLIFLFTLLSFLPRGTPVHVYLLFCLCPWKSVGNFARYHGKLFSQFTFHKELWSSSPLPSSGGPFCCCFPRNSFPGHVGMLAALVACLKCCMSHVTLCI